MHTYIRPRGEPDGRRAAAHGRRGRHHQPPRTAERLWALMYGCHVCLRGDVTNRRREMESLRARTFAKSAAGAYATRASTRLRRRERSRQPPRTAWPSCCSRSRGPRTGRRSSFWILARGFWGARKSAVANVAKLKSQYLTCLCEPRPASAHAWKVSGHSQSVVVRFEEEKRQEPAAGEIFVSRRPGHVTCDRSGGSMPWNLGALAEALHIRRVKEPLLSARI